MGQEKCLGAIFKKKSIQVYGRLFFISYANNTKINTTQYKQTINLIVHIKVVPV